MLKKNLLVALRQFSRQKGYSIINVIGLAVGMATCLVIVQHIRTELSYDKSYPNADRIVRVLREDSAATDIRASAVLLGDLAPSIEDKFAGVERAARVHRRGSVISVGDRQFDEPGFAWTDPAALDIFDLKLNPGFAAGASSTQPSSALARPNTVVLTPDAATRFFGAEDPVGQTLTVNGTTNLEVTGVLAEPLARTHLDVTVLGSMLSLPDGQNPWTPENQGWSYLLLSSADPSARAALMNEINAAVDELAWWWNTDAMYVRYRLQPLTDIYLESAGIQVAGKVGNRRNVQLFAVIAVLILAIAAINYMNLATARAMRRAREVGVRKAIGAGRNNLVLQFMSESLLFSGVAALAAIALMSLSVPVFNRLSGEDVVVNLADPTVWMLVAAVALVTGVVSGSYPAFYLSSFRPTRVLKGLAGHAPGSAGASGLRKSLVVFQFTVTIVLMIGTAVVYQQMRYVQHKDLGFDQSQAVIVPTRGLQSSVESFKQRLLQIPGVVAASAASGAPVLQGGWISESEVDGRKFMTMRILADEDYVETLGMEIVSGRDISTDRAADRTESILVNETMAAMQGWTDPVGQLMPTGTDSLGNAQHAAVVGVIRDFHTNSLHAPIMPVIIDPHPKRAQYVRSLVVRIQGNDAAGTLAAMETEWKAQAPGFPFSFSFIDDSIDALYRADQRFGRLFGVFAVLAALVACLGLLGLAAYMTEQRTKEIGIRKVLGASVSGIVVMLSAGFVRLVLVSFVIAVPIGYLGMRRWLDDFAFRIDPSPWLFVSVGVLATGLAIITVCYQAIRVGKADPVASLRYE